MTNHCSSRGCGTAWSRRGFRSQPRPGRTALEKAKAGSFDLIVLDLMLPEVDGLTVCRQIRKDQMTPIIMLTAKADDVDKILGLELGADDYLTKPFNTRELIARIRAILRRAEAARPRYLRTKWGVGYYLEPEP